MSKDTFDNELNDYLDSQEEKNTCSECGKEIAKDKEYCSKECFDASML